MGSEAMEMEWILGLRIFMFRRLLNAQADSASDLITRERMVSLKEDESRDRQHKFAHNERPWMFSRLS